MMTATDIDTASDAHTARVVRETGLAARVAAIVEPAIEGLGYRLVRVKVSGQNGCTVQIMAERADGTFTIEDCELVSKDISPVLDVDDPVKTAYHLEVSSPGIDRPLVRPIDFVRAVGHEAKIELSRPIDTGTGEGRRRYRGIIHAALDETVELTIDATGGALTVALPYDAIEDARLVMTDALIEAAQKAQDAATADTNDNDSNAGDSA
jgi:ribosome maturation factor RimP